MKTRSKPLHWSEVLRKLFSGTRRKRSTQLQLEALHDRVVPSTTTYAVTALTDGIAGGGTPSGSLRADISTANADATAGDTYIFDLKAGATYSLTLANGPSGHETANATGDLNVASSVNKTYEFVGLGAGAKIDQATADRVFEIQALGGASVQVRFENVTIEGGSAQDSGGNGVLPGTTDAEGGGILNEGGSIFFTNATVKGNEAVGAAGTMGSQPANAGTKPSVPAGAGAIGGNGKNGYGGGLYSTAGTITLTNSTFTGNNADGGMGGNGLAGGNVSASGTGAGGKGGAGGQGGTGAGGGIYAASGNVVLNSGSQVDLNEVYGGDAGAGGAGGVVLANAAGKGGTGGAGGAAGAAGTGYGGGIYAEAGIVTLSGASHVNDNYIQAGYPNTGGFGGAATAMSGGRGGAGGGAGNPGAAIGGGIFAGSVTIGGKSTVNSNIANGYYSGVGGAGGDGSLDGGSGANGGNGGMAEGGGIYADGSVGVATSSLVQGNEAIGAYGYYGGAGGKGIQGAGGVGGNGGNAGRASGGGIFSDSNSVVVNAASVVDNFAEARTAQAGAPGGSGGKTGGDGGDGGSAGSVSGGGIFSLVGNVTLENAAYVEENKAFLEAAGAGGAGGKTSGVANGIAGNGGSGGAGGTASGGGIYAGNGNVFVQNQSEVYDNAAYGQAGAQGAVGASAAGSSARAGLGGSGGSGDSSYGGGIFARSGTVALSSDSTVDDNRVTAEAGGDGGGGGAAEGSQGIAGSGGAGGAGGIAEGGALFILNGQLTVTLGTISSNSARGGAGGNGGSGGDAKAAGAEAGTGGSAGKAGTAEGGGVYSAAGGTLILGGSSLDDNSVYGGAGGIGGDGGSAANRATGAGAGGSGSAGSEAAGGGAFAASGQVDIRASDAYNNRAFGGNGGDGGKGGSAASGTGAGGVGGAAGAGGAAEGGAVWASGGSISVSAGVVARSASASTSAAGAFAGKGATGGAGGGANSKNLAGAGGLGGNGGAAEGGGLFTTTGTIRIAGSNISTLSAVGGAGGRGGAGGSGGGTGGAGGGGGAGGSAQGGDIATSSSGTVDLNSTAAPAAVAEVQGGFTVGGAGGNGGDGGSGIVGGNGGAAGAGGNAAGGGIATDLGNVNGQGAQVTGNSGTQFEPATVQSNSATAGFGGVGGNGGDGHRGGEAGAGGAGGTGYGGGISLGGALSLNETKVSANSALGGDGGAGGVGGTGNTQGIGGSGGVGGNAAGGGIYIANGTSDSLIASNVQANLVGNSAAGRGGSGGAGLTAGIGGNGGSTTGGGLYVSASGNLSITGSSFVQNSVKGAGNGGASPLRAGIGGNASAGGIYTASNATIEISTIGGNSVGVGGNGSLAGLSSGGGLYLAQAIAVSLLDTTVAFNSDEFNFASSSDLGGGIYNRGTLTLTSSLVADNATNGSPAIEPSGTNTGESDVVDLGTTSASNSLIEGIVGQNAIGNIVTGGTSGNQVGVPANDLTAGGVLHPGIDLNPTLFAATTNITYYYTFAAEAENDTAIDSLALNTGGANPNRISSDQIGNPIAQGAPVDAGSIDVPGTPSSFIATSSSNGYVRVINQTTGATLQYFQPFPGYAGLVHVAVGDVFGSDAGHFSVADLVVAALGKVEVFNGMDVTGNEGVVNPVNLGNPSTWGTGSSPNALLATNPLTGLQETSPVIATVSPFGTFRGGINVAIADVNGDGFGDIVVGSGAGMPGEVAAFSGANPLKSLGFKVAFPGYLGGVVVAAGKLNSTSTASVVVGETAGPVVKIFAISNGALVQQGAAINAGVNVGLQLAIFNPTGNPSGLDELAIGTINGGVVSEQVYSLSTTAATLKTKYILGKGYKSFAMSYFTLNQNGPDSLIFAGIPNATNAIEVINPLTGAIEEAFSGFPAFTGAISLGSA